MKPTKAKSLRELGQVELEAKLRDSKENLFKLTLRKSTRQLEDAVSVRVARREVARISTILKQKKPAAATKAGASK